LKPILVASALLAGYLGWRSLGWPLIHDAPLFHYLGWLVGQGVVPYRDVFDMNLPGVYLLHWAVLAAVGPGDLAWRVFDLAWLAATAAALFAFCLPLGGRVGAAAAAVLFTLYHLSGGAWRAGQRDFLLCLFLAAGASGIARAWERRGALWPLAFAGAALAAGLTLKPYAPGLFWLGGVAAGALAARRAGRAALAGAGAVLAGGLAVLALVFGWLAWRGGLGAFVDEYVGYVLPFYGGLGRELPWDAIGGHAYAPALLALLAALVAWGLGVRARPGFGIRRPLALLGLVAGALHFALQGKGWEYHLYPFAFFLCALTAPALAMRPPAPTDEKASTSPRARPLVPRELARAAAVILFAATVLVLGAKGVEAVNAAWIDEKARRVAALARDLGPRVPPGGTVQVMDVTAGGIHALLRLGLREPTRFVYDFHFFHDVSDPRVQALRAEFVAGLAHGRPAAVVIMRETWLRPGYERLDAFPEARDLLARDYALAVEGDGYRIYAKRSGS
jgi:hypothetical protein